MGQYANVINAYALDEARVRVNKTRRQYQSYGQDSYMLNVGIKKFRNDIEKKVPKFVAILEKEKIAKLQQELARLQQKQPA